MSHLDRLVAKQPRPQTPNASAGPVSDQRDLPRASDLQELLHDPRVTVAPDEMRRAVVIVLPLDLAESLADLAPDPLQVQLACALVRDPEDHL